MMQQVNLQESLTTESKILSQKRKKCFKTDESGESVYFNDYDYIEASRLHVASLPLLQQDGLQARSNYHSSSYIQEQYKSKRNNFKREAYDANAKTVGEDITKKSFTTTKESSKTSAIEKCQLALTELSQLICLTNELKSVQNLHLIGKHDDNNTIPIRSNKKLSIQQLIQLKKNNYRVCNSIISNSLNQLNRKSQSSKIYTQFTVALMKKWNVIIAKHIFNDGIRSDNIGEGDSIIRIDCSYYSQKKQDASKSDQISMKMFPTMSASNIATLCIQPTAIGTASSTTSTTSTSIITTKGYQLELTHAEKKYPLKSLKFALLCVATPATPPHNTTTSTAVSEIAIPSYMELASATSWDIHFNNTDATPANLNVSTTDRTPDMNVATPNSTTTTATTASTIADDNMLYIDNHLKKRHHDSFSRLCFQKLRSVMLPEANGKTFPPSSITSSIASITTAIRKDGRNNIIWSASSTLFNVQQPQQQEQQPIKDNIQSLLLSGSSNSDNWISSGSTGGNIEVVEYDELNLSIQLTKHVILRVSLVPIDTTAAEVSIGSSKTVSERVIMKGDDDDDDDDDNIVDTSDESNNNRVHAKTNTNINNDSSDKSVQVITHILKQSLLQCESSVLYSLSNINTDTTATSTASSSALAAGNKRNVGNIVCHHRTVISDTLWVIMSEITQLRLKQVIEYATGLFRPFNSLIHTRSSHSNQNAVDKNEEDEHDENENEGETTLTATQEEAVHHHHHHSISKDKVQLHFFDGSLSIHHHHHHHHSHGDGNTSGNAVSCSYVFLDTGRISSRVIRDSLNRASTAPLLFTSMAELTKYIIAQSLSALLRWFGVQLLVLQQQQFSGNGSSHHPSSSSLSSSSSSSSSRHHHRHLFIHQSTATCLRFHTLATNENSSGQTVTESNNISSTSTSNNFNNSSRNNNDSSSSNNNNNSSCSNENSSDNNNNRSSSSSSSSSTGGASEGKASRMNAHQKNGVNTMATNNSMYSLLATMNVHIHTSNSNPPPPHHHHHTMKDEFHGQSIASQSNPLFEVNQENKIEEEGGGGGDDEKKQQQDSQEADMIESIVITIRFHNNHNDHHDNSTFIDEKLQKYFSYINTTSASNTASASSTNVKDSSLDCNIESEENEEWKKFLETTAVKVAYDVARNAIRIIMFAKVNSNSMSIACMTVARRLYECLTEY